MKINNIDDLRINFNNITHNEALYNSSIYDYLIGIELAIENGADIHYLNDGALFNSIVHDNVEITKYLLEQGADIHVNDEEILRYAIFNNEFETAITIIDLGGNLNIIQNYINKNNFIVYLRKRKLNKIYGY